MASDGLSAHGKNRRFFIRMSCILLAEVAAGGLLLWLALKTDSLFLGFLAYIMWAFGALAIMVIIMGLYLLASNRRTIRRMMKDNMYNNIFNSLTNNQNKKKQ